MVASYSKVLAGRGTCGMPTRLRQKPGVGEGGTAVGSGCCMLQASPTSTSSPTSQAVQASARHRPVTRDACARVWFSCIPATPTRALTERP